MISIRLENLDQFQGDELTDWDRPEKGGGWEAEDQDMSEVLREQRKQVKLQQQQQQ